MRGSMYLRGGVHERGQSSAPSVSLAAARDVQDGAWYVESGSNRVVRETARLAHHAERLLA